MVLFLKNIHQNLDLSSFKRYITHANRYGSFEYTITVWNMFTSIRALLRSLYNVWIRINLEVFSHLSCKQMHKKLCQGVVDQKNAQFYQLKVRNANFCDCFMFLTSKWGKKSSWRANFGVIGKSKATFPIHVHWINFDISNSFLTNWQNIAKNALFIGGDTSTKASSATRG